MKKFIPLLLAVFAVTLASCEKDPDMDKLDNNYLVYTNYDKKADFKTFETYYLPEIGRASCRERVFWVGFMSVVGG